MAIKLAYLGVVLVWTTTPLAIKWSSEGISFVMGVTARMSIGAACLLLLLLITRQAIRFSRPACWTYLAVSVQLYLSMIITYWAAQFIPSGWMSVIFGLSPFMTAFMAAAILQERSLGWLKLAAYSFGVAGLMVMFMSAMALSEQALIGVAAMLLSTFIHALSAVWVKRIDAQLPAIQQISGGMLLSLPLYWASWYWLDGEIPEQIPQQTLWAVIYLGLIATTFGFALYYYVLKHLPATQVAMINLMTPVLSLWLGYTANQEPVSLKVIIGTGLIMSALLIHQIAERRQRKQLSKLT